MDGTRDHNVKESKPVSFIYLNENRTVNPVEIVVNRG
jgi:hypothetical protein